MINTVFIEEMAEQMKDLPEDLQQQALEMVRCLREKGGKGVPGKTLLRFAGGISPVDAQTMQRTIESDCERIDIDEW
ncbi:MAG: hypothetical protein AB1547_07795 [Thermodesulfobacteriota bacterium]